VTSRPDLIRRLALLADDLAPLTPPASWIDQLRGLCDTARLVLGAAAVSVARTVDADTRPDSPQPDSPEPESADPRGGLVYVAASGEGADQITGTRLASGSGLAGFVVASGQSLAIDRVQDDVRFARDIAEATGYVPTSLLIVPINSTNGDVLGLLSVLDRGTMTAQSSFDALEVASAFAAQAAFVLPRIDLLVRLGPVLVQAIADAVAHDDHDLAAALGRIATRLGPPDDELAATAALLAELRSRPTETRRRVERVLSELLALTEPRRRR